MPLAQEWRWHDLEQGLSAGLEWAPVCRAGPTSRAPNVNSDRFCLCVVLRCAVRISSPETGQTSPTGFYSVLA